MLLLLLLDAATRRWRWQQRNESSSLAALAVDVLSSVERKFIASEPEICGNRLRSEIAKITEGIGF